MKISILFHQPSSARQPEASSGGFFHIAPGSAQKPIFSLRVLAIWLCQCKLAIASVRFGALRGHSLQHTKNNDQGIASWTLVYRMILSCNETLHSRKSGSAPQIVLQCKASSLIQRTIWELYSMSAPRKPV